MYSEIIDDIELKDPILFYNQRGEPLFWRVYALNGERVIMMFDIDADSGENTHTAGCPNSQDECFGWFSPEGAKEALINYLTKNGITYESVSDARFICYPVVVLQY